MSETPEPFTYLEDVVAAVGEVPADSILSRTLYQDSRCRVIAFGFAPGQELSEHTASKPAMLHILQGEGSLTLGAEKRTFRPGAWAYMQPNLPHSLHADSPVVMLLTLLETG